MPRRAHAVALVDPEHEQGIATVTFRILTPYPGTALFQRLTAQGRLQHRNRGLCDSRYVVLR